MSEIINEIREACRAIKGAALALTDLSNLVGDWLIAWVIATILIGLLLALSCLAIAVRVGGDNPTTRRIDKPQ